MKFLKKLFIFIAILICLFCISYLPECAIGEFFFKHKLIEISTPANIALMFVVVIIFGISFTKNFIKYLSSLFRRDRNKKNIESLNAIIELILAKKISDVKAILAKSHISNEHEPLKDAAICSVLEKSNVIYSKFFKLNDVSKKTNELLFVYEIKQNILKNIDGENYNNAASLVNEVVKNHYKYVYVIQDAILKLIGHEKIDFDPRKFKYNLSPKYVEKYTELLTLHDYYISKKVSLLEKFNKNYPGNVKVSKVLIEDISSSTTVSKSDEKKILEIIKNGVEKNMDRSFAYSLLRIKNRPDMFEIAMMLVQNIADDNIEKLWFLCIVACDIGNISHACELLQKIIASSKCDIDDLFRFYILNHSKFSNNIELLQNLKGIIKENSVDKPL